MQKMFKSLRKDSTNRPPSQLLDTSGREVNESSLFFSSLLGSLVSL